MGTPFAGIDNGERETVLVVGYPALPGQSFDKSMDHKRLNHTQNTQRRRTIRQNLGKGDREQPMVKPHDKIY